MARESHGGPGTRGPRAASQQPASPQLGDARESGPFPDSWADEPDVEAPLPLMREATLPEAPPPLAREATLPEAPPPLAREATLLEAPLPRTGEAALLEEVYRGVNRLGAQQESMKLTLELTLSVVSRLAKAGGVPAYPAERRHSGDRGTSPLRPSVLDRANRRSAYAPPPPATTKAAWSPGRTAADLPNPNPRLKVAGSHTSFGNIEEESSHSMAVHASVIEGMPDGWPGSIGIRKGFERGRPDVDGEHRVYHKIATKLLSNETEEEEDTTNAARQYVLDPNSEVAVAIAWVGLVLVVYDVMVTPYVLAWAVTQSMALNVCGTISAAYWTICVLISCRTGFYENGELQMRRSAILRHYAKTWLVFDVLLVASDWVALANVDGSNSGFLRMLRACRMMKMLRMAKVFIVVENLVTYKFRRARRIVILLQVAFGTVVITHLLTCAWYAIGVFGPTDTGRHWVVPFDEEEYGMVYRYLSAYHFTLAGITLDSTEIMPVNSAERGFLIVILLIGVVFNSLIFSLVSAQALEYVAARRDHMETLMKLKMFLAQNRIPAPLSAKVTQQVQHRIQDHSILLSEHNVAALDVVSSSLRVALLRETRMPHLMRHPLFRIWADLDPKSIKALCDKAVRFVTLLHQDVVFSPGQVATEALHLVKGTLRYSQEIETSYVDVPSIMDVGEKTWICEAALWSQWVHVGSLETSTTCLLMGLSASGLLHVMQRHPSIAQLTKTYARAYHSRITTAVPPYCHWPNDINVPCTNPAGLLSHKVGLALLEKKYASRELQMSDDEYEVLREQVINETCAVLESEVDGALERIVVLSVLHLVDTQGQVLVRVGKWHKNGQPTTNCVLPGIRAFRGELPQITLERLITGSLHTIADGIELTHREEDLEVKVSDRFRLRTRYLRSTQHGVLRPGFDFGQQVPVAVHRSFWSGQPRSAMPTSMSSSSASGRTGNLLRSGSLASSLGERLLQTRVYGLGSGDCLYLHAWLTQLDYDRLSHGGGANELQNWITNLEWAPGCQQVQDWGSPQQEEQVQGTGDHCQRTRV